jgi:elongator complex protein 4
MAAITSFRKKTSSKSSHPMGTRPSLHNAQLLISTGVPSMDTLIGGGLPVGATLLIEEDVYQMYSQLLMKYFIAEGVMCGHDIMICGPSADDNIIEDLPAATGIDKDHIMPLLEEEEESGTTEMKIAWRYQDLPKVTTSFSNQFGHHFDMTKKMSKERLSSVNFNTLKLQGESSVEMYQTLLEAIENEIKKQQTSSLSTPKTVLRVIIHSIGSPLWLEDTSRESADITRFFHSLRDLLRSSNTVAAVSIPTHLFQNHSFIRRIERLNDCVIRLESFAGSDKESNPLYKEFRGLFHICKLPRINSLICHSLDTLDFGFKLKRKNFLIEKLHLPPELPETTNRSQEDNKMIDRTKIDF